MVSIFDFLFTYLRLMIAFKWHQIVPDVITSPPYSLTTYSWPGVNASLGNTATPTQV